MIEQESSPVRIDINDKLEQQVESDEVNDFIDRYFDHSVQITEIKSAATEGTKVLSVEQHRDFHSTVLEKMPEDLQPTSKSTVWQPDSNKPINLHETVKE